MSTSAYIPPHLRRAQPPDQRKPSFVQLPLQSPASIMMKRSQSMPEKFQDITDAEIVELFDANDENPSFSVYEGEIKIQTENQIDQITAFPKSGISNSLLKNIALMKYKTPTPVQKTTIPYILAGHDLIVTAQTGSGKTAAFMLPSLTRMLDRGCGGYPQIVVLVPTRELAIQIRNEAVKFCDNCQVKIVSIYGGEPINRQSTHFFSACDVLIATPGRLIDLYERGIVLLHETQILILDEADRMLDMGFEPQISQIILKSDMPPPEKRQTLLFSATFPRQLENLCQKFLHKTTKIEIGLQNPPSLIKQQFTFVPEESKRKALLDCINTVNGPTLVFAERRTSVDSIEEFLASNNLPVVAIHGDREMVDRMAALRGFQRGKASVMVATDVAARGIDISNVVHVINYDLPTDVDSYIHRIGRTGRAGNEGVATSFFNEGNNNFLFTLVSHFHRTNQDIPSGLEEFEKNCKKERYQLNHRSSRPIQRDKSWNSFHKY